MRNSETPEALRYPAFCEIEDYRYCRAYYPADWVGQANPQKAVFREENVGEDYTQEQVGEGSHHEVLHLSCATENRVAAHLERYKNVERNGYPQEHCAGADYFVYIRFGFFSNKKTYELRGENKHCGDESRAYADYHNEGEPEAAGYALEPMRADILGGKAC